MLRDKSEQGRRITSSGHAVPAMTTWVRRLRWSGAVTMEWCDPAGIATGRRGSALPLIPQLPAIAVLVSGRAAANRSHVTFQSRVTGDGGDKPCLSATDLAGLILCL